MTGRQRVRSTTFRGGWRNSLSSDDAKREQETVVVTAFANALQSVSGAQVTFELLDLVQQPPDALLRCGDQVLGAELVELEGAYSERGFVEELKNAFYRETEARRFAEPYLGTCISICPRHSGFGFHDAIQTEWVRHGVRSGVATFAKALCDLVVTKVRNRDLLPRPTDLRQDMVIATKGYPALETIAPDVWMSRSPEHDIRRSDNRAAPLLIISGGFMYREGEMGRRAADVVSRKMQDRGRWTVKVDRAILVVHDLPRRHFKFGFHEWDVELRRALAGLKTNDSFDEVWLVNYKDPFAEPIVMRIDV
jgi:hypothetical protein